MTAVSATLESGIAFAASHADDPFEAMDDVITLHRSPGRWCFAHSGTIATSSHARSIVERKA